MQNFGMVCPWTKSRKHETDKTTDWLGNSFNRCPKIIYQKSPTFSSILAYFLQDMALQETQDGLQTCPGGWGGRAGGRAGGAIGRLLIGRRRRREGIALGRPNEAVQNGERGRGGRGRCGPAQWGRGRRREHSIIHDMVWYAQRPLESLLYGDKALNVTWNLRYTCTYRVTNKVGKWVGLTLIWDVQPYCLGADLARYPLVISLLNPFTDLMGHPVIVRKLIKSTVMRELYW